MVGRTLAVFSAIALALVGWRKIPDSLVEPLKRPAFVPKSYLKYSTAPQKPTQKLDDRIDDFLRRAASLRDDDGEELFELEQAAAHEVSSDPEAFKAYFLRRAANLENLIESSGFFLLKILFDDEREASEMVEPLLRRTTTPESALALGRLKTYAIERIENPALVPLLVDIAKHDPDLAVAREAMLALSRLDGKSEARDRDIIETRSPGDRFAFRDL